MSDISVASESTCSVERSESPSNLVVESIAREEDVDPLNLEVPLYEAIDPDALDALFQSDDDAFSGRITFEYYGYEVTVSDAGHVSLDAVDGR